MAPAHRKQGEGEGTPYWSTFRIVAAIATAVVVVAAGVATAVVVTTRHNNRTQISAGSRPAKGGRGTGGTKPVSGGTSGSRSTPSSSSTTSTTQPPTPLSVRSVTPGKAAHGVGTDQVISITFSHAVAANSPTPTLSPAILGSWSRRGDALIFRPKAGYVPSTQVTVDVPASTRAVEDNRPIQLGHSFQTSFRVGTGSVLRLQQLLAELGYLPLSFERGTRPATTHGATTTAVTLTSGLSAEPVSADAISTNPKPGQFVWKYPKTPAALQAQWQVGTYNLITKGAVMAFEGDHGLTVDGVAGQQVWTTLLKAVAARQMDPRKYDYIMVNEEGTEYLRVWQDGAIVYTSLANTGVPGAATQQGTFAVETHYEVTTMKGTDVDGSTYDVQVPYAAYFNGGDAIHGYPRASYGFPQSNGCVELPIPNAAQVFNSGEDWYGTLVTVS